MKTKKLFYLFKPFKTDVWEAAALTFALSTLCFCSLDYLGNKIRNEHTEEHAVLTSTNTVWYIVQLWLFQSKKKDNMTILLPNILLTITSTMLQLDKESQKQYITTNYEICDNSNLPLNKVEHIFSFFCIYNYNFFRVSPKIPA